MSRRAAAAAALLAAALTGCPAPRQVVRPPPRPADAAAAPAPPLPLAPAEHEELAISGAVHVVRRGETLYRIARAYGIDLADLMETNGISDPRTVAVGTELFVPGAAAPVEVPPAGAASPAEAAAHPAPAPPDQAPAGAADARSPADPARPPPDQRVAATTPSPATTDAGKPPLAWPLKGVLYGRFGVRAGQRHDGIDVAAPEGTAVGAAADGTVLFAGEQAGYGAIVILRHEGGLVTLYAHNATVLVHEGAHVRRGQPIARVGQTGRTTGPHLHFEVREGTRPRNPLLFLP